MILGGFLINCNLDIKNMLIEVCMKHIFNAFVNKFKYIRLNIYWQNPCIVIDLIINQNVILYKSEKNKDEVDGRMNWEEKKNI